MKALQEDLLVEAHVSIKDLIKKMDQSGNKMACVVSEDQKLLAVVTDGDIRRWILKSGDLKEPISSIMNSRPKVIFDHESLDKAKELMIKYKIEWIPIVTKDYKLISQTRWVDFFEDKKDLHGTLDQSVVIMAGGLGSRLWPLTKVLPKPLIPINDKTITERIIERFQSVGCQNFYLSINYKANLIRAYFQDLEKSYRIQYVEESQPLGTAGSLALLKDELKDTFFVINCDILIDGDYVDMFHRHRSSQNQITIVTSLKHEKIAYGVCHLNSSSLLSHIEEKPEMDFLINTGMYILEPEVLNDIPPNQCYHITDLINDCLKKQKPVGIYPISEKSWMDMGQIKDMEDMMIRLGTKR